MLSCRTNAPGLSAAIKGCAVAAVAIIALLANVVGSADRRPCDTFTKALGVWMAGGLATAAVGANIRARSQGAVEHALGMGKLGRPGVAFRPRAGRQRSSGSRRVAWCDRRGGPTLRRPEGRREGGGEEEGVEKVTGAMYWVCCGG